MHQLIAARFVSRAQRSAIARRRDARKRAYGGALLNRGRTESQVGTVPGLRRTIAWRARARDTCGVNCPPDSSPLTRTRAFTLCGAII